MTSIALPPFHLFHLPVSDPNVPLDRFYQVDLREYQRLKSALTNVHGRPLRSAFLVDSLLDTISETSSNNVKILHSHISSLEASLHRLRRTLAEHEELAATIVEIKSLPFLSIPALPYDIFRRIIVEKACAPVDEGVVSFAKTLSLVSKTIQDWVDPILFSTVTLDLYDSSMEDLQVAALASKRLERLLPQISVIQVSSWDIDGEKWPTLNRLFPAVSTLVSSDCFPSIEIVAPWLKCLHTPYKHAILDFSLPIFDSITHLSMSTIKRSHVQDSLFPALCNRHSWPSLQILALKTHFMANPQVRNIRVMSDLTQQLLTTSFPRLEVVIWKVREWQSELGGVPERESLYGSIFPDELAKDAAADACDPRLVICVPRPFGSPEGEVWPFLCMGHSKGGFWSFDVADQALRLARERKQAFKVSEGRF
ncbi:hypothetical protein DL96DRAFT_1576925 [Flagelloscypha sp. PMI_526]|nr:hypothetical protein DL96DRAFT_1576925 [Flagelloscypha sp. PMI_526]